MDYDEYGNDDSDVHGEIDEYTGGFQQEELSLDDDGGLGGDWLAAQEERDSESRGPEEGGATAADWQLGRFSNTDMQVRAATAGLIDGSFTGDKAGIDSIDTGEAVARFGKVIGSDPKAWVKQLDVQAAEPVYQIDIGSVGTWEGKVTGKNTPTTNPHMGDITGTINVTPDAKAIRTAVRMMGVTADEYEYLGAGSKVAGNIYGESGSQKDAPLIQDLPENYQGVTKGSSKNNFLVKLMLLPKR